jgi:hypothetical protein
MALIPPLSLLYFSILPFLFLSLSPVSSSTWLSVNSSSFLSEIVDAFAEKEKWDPKSEVRVRVSDSDQRMSKVGVLNRYEFKAKVGRKQRLGMRFSDEAVQWRRVGESVVVQSDSNLIAGDEVGLVSPVVQDLELTGPLELMVRVEGRKDDWISLHLPTVSV